ncbi:hypothetical protein K439DRAFT_1648612 [Ramaria rubella]|nr:hypothetical protein K439DRAFT_1648612 [Ramaria rubella]
MPGLRFIVQYNDVHMDPLPLQLPPGQRQHHFIFQDELTFHANDLEDSVYLAPGEQELRKKGCGRLVHVSYFVIKSMGYVAVFFFDCSSAHEAFAPDALCTQKMNVKPGGNQPHMHSTVIPLDCPAVSKCGTHQSMVFTSADTNDPQLIGKPKGMAWICEECSLTQVISAANKGRVEYGEPTYLDNASLGIQSNHNDCCMFQALAGQSDFANEKSMLQTIIEAAGHQCIFLPKFHCELNPIEPLGVLQKFSEVADGSFATAQREVPRCLDKCSTLIIWRFFCKCYKYMDAYRKGLSGKDADHTVKKYKSHRKVGQGIVIDINMIT